MEAVLIAAVIIALVWVFTRKPKGRCQRCGQKVDRRAQVCPYCGNDFSSSVPSP